MFLVVVVFLFCFFIFLYILPWTALWITFNDFFLYIMRCRFHFHIRILKVLLRNIQCINLGETGMLNLHFILYVLKTCCFSINLNSHHSSPVSFVYCKVQKMFFKCSLYRPVFVLDNKWFFSCLLSLSFSVTEQMTTIIARSELSVTDPSDYPPSVRVNPTTRKPETDRFRFINQFIYLFFIYLFIYFICLFYLSFYFLYILFINIKCRMMWVVFQGIYNICAFRFRFSYLFIYNFFLLYLIFLFIYLFILINYLFLVMKCKIICFVLQGFLQWIIYMYFIMRGNFSMCEINLVEQSYRLFSNWKLVSYHSLWI